MAQNSSETLIDEISPLELISALWQGRWIIIAISAAFLLIGGIYTFVFNPQVYKAQALIKLENQIAQAISGQIQIISTPATAQDFEAEKVRILSPETMTKVIAGLNLASDPEFAGNGDGSAGNTATALAELQDRTTVNVLTRSGLLEINVRTFDPEKSARIATALSEAYLIDQAARAVTEGVSVDLQIGSEEGGLVWARETLSDVKSRFGKIKMEELPSLDENKAMLDDIERVFEGAVSLYGYLLSTLEDHRQGETFPIGVRHLVSDVIVPAEVPLEPESPRRLLALAMSLAIGGFLAILAVLVRWFVSRPIAGSQDIASRFGIPYWGAPDFESTPSAATRSLRNALILQAPAPGSVIVALSSTDRAIAATSVAKDLAKSCREVGKRTILVDAETEAPDISQSLQSVVSGQIELDALLKANDECVPLGTAQSKVDAGAIIATAAFEEILRELCQQYDVVILNTPSVLDEPDATLLFRLADFSVLLARRGKTPSATIRKAVSLARQSGVRSLGLTLAHAKPAR